MIKASGLARLGRDAEVRRTAGGEVVASLSLAFTSSKKNPDGTRIAQWVEGTLWGKRAESLAPYLTKGTQILVYLDDVMSIGFEKRDGTPSHKMVARVTDIEFASAKNNADSGEVPVKNQHSPNDYELAKGGPAPSKAMAPQSGGSGFEDIDDDIPF